jgi:hypothetical protein
MNYCNQCLSCIEYSTQVYETDELRDLAWMCTTPTPLDPNRVFAKDRNNRLIAWSAYGDARSPYGWFVQTVQQGDLVLIEALHYPDRAANDPCFVAEAARKRA